MKSSTASGLEREEDEEETYHNRQSELIMSTLLTIFGMPAARIDRRPSLSSKPFDDVYFVEFEHKKRAHSPGRPFKYTLEGITWLSRIQAGIEHIRNVKGEATLLGVW